MQTYERTGQVIQLLDVTLRDGGIVNDFKFGEENIKSILHAVENSGIRYVELGYLEKNTGTERGRSQYCNERVIERYILTEKMPDVTYFAMFDYGKFDAHLLGERTSGGIDAIRLAFHKRNYHDALPLYRLVSEKGYDVYMQPMVTLHYSDDELKELASEANRLGVKGLYFVDTFGQMQQDDVERIASLFDRYLDSEISLGFHSHNNIQMAFANAITFLKMPMARDKMLDSSILGMGRGAGNLNTELILSYLNRYYDDDYTVQPLLHVIDTILSTIKERYPWGYSVEYYLSSVNDCSPIYAGHYYKKHMLPVEKINELLGMVSGEKRISFDKNYAEEIYRRYNAGEPYDDADATEKLRRELEGKKVCVLAPGKSIKDCGKKIEDVCAETDVTVSLNCDLFQADYELFTREDVFENSRDTAKKVIIPSNITRDEKENRYIIDYLRWITVNDETRDSSGYIVINLLAGLGVKEILLAGFDGFTADVEENYYDASLQKPVSPELVEERNRAFAQFVCEKRKSVPIRFVTESLYEKY